MRKIMTFLLIFTLLLAGCTNLISKTTKEPVKSNNSEITGELKVVKGTLEAKFYEKDIPYMILEVDNISEKLDASNLEDFDLLEDGSTLTVTKYENNKIEELISVEDIEDFGNDFDEDDEVIRIISYSELIDLENLTGYKNFNLENYPELDINKISLYTDAENDGAGNFYWDDGNRFVLIAHKGNGGFILFDSRIQIGEAKVNIYSLEDNLNISVLEYGTANISFRIFKYVDGEFVENIKYQSQGNVNMLNNF